MKKIYKLAGVLLSGMLLSTTSVEAQAVSDFESLTLAPNSFWNGSDLSGVNTPKKFTTKFTSGDAEFTNVWDTTYGGPGYWTSGFAQSTQTDSVTSGPGNLYSAKAASGNNGSLTYLAAQNNSKIALKNGAENAVVTGIYVTNGTYAANSMRDGDAIAKKFGGATGNDPDWFLLTIKGVDAAGNLTTDSVNFYLADYRFSDNTQDYIVDSWEFVDLTSLGSVKDLTFKLTSSDVGSWGMNTPAFFCIDDLKSTGAALIDFEDLGFTTADSVWNGNDYSGTPDDLLFRSVFVDGDAEFKNVWNTQWGGYWSDGFAYSNMTDSTTAGAGNLYSARPATGVKGSSNYVVSQNFTGVKLTGDAEDKELRGVFVTNTTFAALSMANGDAIAKKFGGATGDDPDWFRLTIRGYNDGVMVADSVDFYLADFRFTDNSQDYIVTTWEWVNLTSLGTIDSVSFQLNSSDVGSAGMYTPAFFAMDDFNGIVLSTEDPFGSDDFVSVYPNPAKNVLNIASSSEVSEVQIFDLSGGLVKSVTNRANQQQIDVTDLRSGVYVVRYNVSGKLHTQRVIIQ
ncbi:DUF4465 domain-containing protein [bacterium SCSIO 12643]|nr:DUF4465 domain-containing protein [bacterium SCSIO 12643]